MSDQSPPQNNNATSARRSRKKLSEAERIKQMEKEALNAAILKPFIESLFDENRDGTGGPSGGGGGAKDKKYEEEEEQLAAGAVEKWKSVNTELPLQPSTGATIGVSGMPSMRYYEALNRETSKPFRLNTLVSIDAAPLPTRTANPVYMELIQPRTGEQPQHAACLNHEYRQHLRDAFIQGSRTNLHSPTKIGSHNNNANRIGVLDDEDDEENGGGGRSNYEQELLKQLQTQQTGMAKQAVRPPDIYNPVKQAKMLEDAHLEMLMRTVKQTKEKTMYDELWKKAQGRFAW